MKLYVDMDGVLVDFETQANRLLPGLFSAPGVWVDITRDQWIELEKDPAFWSGMKPAPGAIMMWERMMAEGMDPQILTAAGGTDKFLCQDHKLDWCESWLPGFEAKRFNCVHKFLRKQEFCTGQNSILVDDYARNIEQWMERDGLAIFHTNPYDTLRRLRKIYENG